MTSRGFRVDSKMVIILEKFWRNGFETTYSCQGHSDYFAWTKSQKRDCEGYIMFKDEDFTKLLRLLNSLVEWTVYVTEQQVPEPEDDTFGFYNPKFIVGDLPRKSLLFSPFHSGQAALSFHTSDRTALINDLYPALYYKRWHTPINEPVVILK